MMRKKIMTRIICAKSWWCVYGAIFTMALSAQDSSLGREVSIARHLHDGDEFDLSIPKLIEVGKKLFQANWTIQEGAGCPQSKGTGTVLSDQSAPLVFPRAWNRVSGPDAHSCAG